MGIESSGSNISEEHICRGLRADIEMLSEAREWRRRISRGAIPSAANIERMLRAAPYSPNVQPEAPLENAAVERQGVEFHLCLTWFVYCYLTTASLALNSLSIRIQSRQLGPPICSRGLDTTWGYLMNQ
jgi:hypothetical protein